MTVAVLFARKDSHYKALQGVDVWDIERDARNWPGGRAVVAHPPCRSWGRLRHMATAVKPGEKELALFAVRQVRAFGGVLEHPAGSTLWAEAGLPRPGPHDEFGGWTLPILQSWWGHKADKATWLYIVGCAPADIPTMPFRLGRATHVISTSGRRIDGRRLSKGDHGWRPEVSKAEREHTPPQLAAWLVDLAARCRMRQAA